MKKIILKNFKTIITILITSIVCISGTAFAARMMNAKDIIFTATNANFKAGNVGDAIDGLYNEAQKEQKYSLEEQVVGTWIDGKPIYRKVIYMNETVTSTEKIIGPVGMNNIDSIVNYSCLAKRIDNLNIAPYWQNSGNFWSCYVFEENNNLRTGAVVGGTFSNFRFIVEYTKTTDEAKS